MKILIAENDAAGRKFLSEFLLKYGECEFTADGPEALGAFVRALKAKEPYRLICIDIMIPDADAVPNTIRELEKQHGVPPEKGAKIITMTGPAGATGFQCAAGTYDTQKFSELLTKLGFDGEDAPRTRTDPGKKNNASKRGPRKNPAPKMANEKTGYFKSVHALPDYQLEVIMETGTKIHFDFRPRLDTARFGKLKDNEQFGSAVPTGTI